MEVPGTEVVADAPRSLPSDDAAVVIVGGTKVRVVVSPAAACWASDEDVVEDPLVKVVGLRAWEDIEVEVRARPVLSANCEETAERELAGAS